MNPGGKHPLVQWLEDSIEEDRQERARLVLFLDQHQTDYDGLITACLCGDWRDDGSTNSSTWAEHLATVLKEKYRVHPRP